MKREPVALIDMDVEDLRDECGRLRACFETILSCEDGRCSLCGRCLHALLPPLVAVAPPAIAADDPIRTYRAPRGRSRKHPHAA